MGYHHGDLRTAMIDAGTTLVAEGGLPALSVAEAARRTGVSAAAPYRHFPTRQHFLIAVAAKAAQDLDAAMRTAADAAGPDPVEAIAAAAAAYVRFAATRRAGFDLVYAPELRGVHDEELREAGRSVSDIVLLRAIEATGGDSRAAVDIVPQFMIVAQGAASMHLIGILSDVESAARLAAKTIRSLLRSAPGE
ncbi:MAG TPA: TetR/AcrR family transcriptional regulator [Propionicimonas sp.]|nr:TetR/AcrR family transcriptional regulator [Propionicimonas sp.]HQA78349.1 TetR/AcrR family transcriptional regulator [Propionicimonas sp.]HQD97564.1 TetR/AcrR family transcriptional regulator [Propionicimonas sp.]